MVAVEHLVRFYVDQSAAGLGLALAAARKDTIHCGHPLIPECPRRARRPRVDSRRGRARPRRDRPRQEAPEQASRGARALGHGLRVFCIGGKRDLSTWEWLARVVRHWPRMRSSSRARAGPVDIHAQRDGRRRVRAEVGRRPAVSR